MNGYAMSGAFWYSTVCDMTIASDRAVFARRSAAHLEHPDVSVCGAVRLEGSEPLHASPVTTSTPMKRSASAWSTRSCRTTSVPTARQLAERIAMVPEPSVRLNKHVTTYGLLASGVAAGMLMNGPLSALAHTSHGPERDRLYEAQAHNGMKGFLEAQRPRLPSEPFGPKSR
ncbi:MAG: hypothetical protein U0531_04420 [Dehalococcoidia bacterium]